LVVFRPYKTAHHCVEPRDHLSELASTVLHVEPPTLAARGATADDDIVDFGIEVAGNTHPANRPSGGGGGATLNDLAST
jgi:hypothetical protein